MGISQQNPQGFGPFPVRVDRSRWMNQQQDHPLDYLREENRVLRELIGDKRLRLNDGQRRRLGKANWPDADAGRDDRHARDDVCPGTVA